MQKKYKRYKDSVIVGPVPKHYTNLTGSKIGMLTILDPVGIDFRKKVIFKCKCDCGEYIQLTQIRMSTGKLASCGCQRRVVRFGFVPHNRIHDSKIACVNDTLARYRATCRRNGREFLLTRDEFTELLFGRCFYCNREPSNTYHRTRHTYKYNGIDRIDNSKGYIKTNCRTCCYKCNFMKKEFSESDFLQHVEYIYNFSVKGRKI